MSAPSMTTEDALALFRLRRSARVPRTPDEEIGRAQHRRGGLTGAASVWSVEAERRAGVARHATRFGSTLGESVGREVYELVRDEAGASFGRIITHGADAFLDGYDLGRVLGGVPDGAPGKELKTRAATTAWIKRALGARRAAGDGPLAAVLADLMAEWTVNLREDVADEAMTRALRAAFVVGLLAVVHEHGAKHPWIEPLVSATAPRPAPKEIAAHVAMDPALLDGVLAAPEDDAPRLVLADWLSERNDPRGELIQIQCAVGRRLTGATLHASKPRHRPESLDDLKAREAKLLRKFGPAWSRAEAPALTRRVWHRGFVEGGYADAAGFADAMPTLVRTPLDSVKLEGLGARDVPKLASAPAHPTLFGIDLSSNRIDRNRASIFGSALLAGVRALSLHGNDIGDERAIRALTEGPRSVVRLSVHHCGLTDASVAALAETALFSRLTHLALGEHALTIASLAALARATSLTCLWATETFLRTVEDAAALIEHAPSTLRVVHGGLRLTNDAKQMLARRFDLRVGYEDLPLGRTA